MCAPTNPKRNPKKIGINISLDSTSSHITFFFWHIRSEPQKCKGLFLCQTHATFTLWPQHPPFDDSFTNPEPRPIHPPTCHTRMPLHHYCPSLSATPSIRPWLPGCSMNFIGRSRCTSTSVRKTETKPWQQTWPWHRIINPHRRRDRWHITQQHDSSPICNRPFPVQSTVFSCLVFYRNNTLCGNWGCL